MEIGIYGKAVLPDGPATRGAATPLRTEAFGGALLLVAIEIYSRPTGGPREAVIRRANARPTHSGYSLQNILVEFLNSFSGVGDGNDSANVQILNCWPLERLAIPVGEVGGCVVGGLEEGEEGVFGGGGGAEVFVGEDELA